MKSVNHTQSNFHKSNIDYVSIENGPVLSTGVDIEAPEAVNLLHSDIEKRDPSTDSSETAWEGDEKTCNDDEKTIICEELPFTRLVMVMSTAWLGVFLGAADTTVIATLSAPISSEFNSLSLLSWLATAYLISNSASQPISGRLTDIFGRGPGLVFCNIVFSLGNLLCGLATNQYVLILGRFVAGIGGGGLMSIPTFLGSDFVPLRRRGLIGGIANLWYGAGTMTGAVLGGFLNDRLGWRLAFYIQVPLSLLSALIVHLLIKVPPKQSSKSYLKRIDFGGVILISSFMTLFVLGLSSGGNLVPWTHFLPPAAISLSVVLFIAFIWWERKASQPILPIRVLLNRTVLISCVVSLFCAGIALTCIFYVPLYLQARGDSATSAGLEITPASIGTSFGALFSGYVVKRTGRYVGLVISSVVALIIGVAMFTLQDGKSPIWLTSVAFFMVGAGYNAVFTITQVACLAAVDHSYQAVVTSSTYLARSLGSTIGVTVASVVYQNKLSADLWQRFGSEPNANAMIQRILDDLSQLQNLPPGWYEGVMLSFVQSFRYVWLLTLSWAILALIFIAAIKQHALHSTLERKQALEEED